MKIIPLKNPVVEITDFEKQNGIELEFVGHRNGTWSAKFPNTEVLDGAFLISSCGRGKTQLQAIRDYCKQISNKTLVFHAYSPHRKEIITNKIVHTKKD